METKDWYKLTFLIESDSEEIIIWKLNELGIFSFSFEYLIKNENKKRLTYGFQSMIGARVLGVVLKK